MELTITTPGIDRSGYDEEVQLHNCLHDSVDRLDDRLDDLGSRLDALTEKTDGLATGLGTAQARLRKLDEDQREHNDMLVEVLQRFDLPD